MSSIALSFNGHTGVQEFLAALRKVIVAFDTLDIEYALGGSLASSLHGEPRATRDVDLIAAVAGKHAAPLVAALRPELYVAETESSPLTINYIPSPRRELHRPKPFSGLRQCRQNASTGIFLPFVRGPN
jgi:hypothetical protein